MAKAGKGAAFEREFCRQLSLWWSGGRRDDLFWRTSNSGGRATVRSRSGKRTSGHYGDICATDGEGKVLLDLITFELKRGYSRSTLADLLDKAPGAKQQQYEEWVGKVRKTAVEAGTPWWMLVHRRDRRECVVTVPDDLVASFGVRVSGVPMLRWSCGQYEMTQFRLQDFLAATSPDSVKLAHFSGTINGEPA